MGVEFPENNIDSVHMKRETGFIGQTDRVNIQHIALMCDTVIADSILASDLHADDIARFGRDRVDDNVISQF